MRNLLTSTALAAVLALMMAPAQAQVSIGAGGSTNALVNTGGMSSGFGVNNNTGLGVGAGGVAINSGLNSATGVNLATPGSRYVAPGVVRSTGTTIRTSSATPTYYAPRYSTGVNVGSNVNASANSATVVNTTSGLGATTTTTIRDQASGATRTISRTTDGVVGSVTDTISTPLGVSSSNYSAAGTNISAGSSSIR